MVIFKILLKDHGTARSERAKLCMLSAAVQCTPELNIGLDCGGDRDWVVTANLQKFPDF